MATRITKENFHKIWKLIVVRVTDAFTTPPVVFKIGGSTVGTLGNFSASTGKGKSKKTFNVCAIVAAALSGRTVLNYEPSFPEDKRRVLYFDTEQSSYHCHKVLERINKLVGYPPDYDCDRIDFVMLREYSPIERRQIIELALDERPGVGLVIIDGLRDLLFDINSSSEAAEVIGLLMRWTSLYNIHIHTVLHLNKGDDNVRGHIGTELNHKAETILQICVNDNDSTISEVHPAMVRDRDFVPFAFRINNEGLPEIVDGVDMTHKPKISSFDYENMTEELHRQALDIAFGTDDENPESSPLSYSPLLKRLAVGYKSLGYSRGRNAQVNLLKFLLSKGIISCFDRNYVYNRDFHYVPPCER